MEKLHSGLGVTCAGTHPESRLNEALFRAGLVDEIDIINVTQNPATEPEQLADMSKSKVILPSPVTGTMPLETAIIQRRSLRNYLKRDLTIQQIGQLLWAAQGITGKKSTHRAAPSADACHPLTVYVCLPSGVWQYHPEGHYLTRHLEKDVRTNLAKAAMDQQFVQDASCVLVICVAFERASTLYGEELIRTRSIPIEAGRSSECSSAGCFTATGRMPGECIS